MYIRLELGRKETTMYNSKDEIQEPTEDRTTPSEVMDLDNVPAPIGGRGIVALHADHASLRQARAIGRESVSDLCRKCVWLWWLERLDPSQKVGTCTLGELPGSYIRGSTALHF